MSSEEYKSFCEENHVQGYAPAKIKIGLFNENRLVSLMSFSKPRFKSKHTYEMVRFCNKIETKVHGSASKLFNYFKNNFDFDSLITFSDNRLFSGKIYTKLGFEFSHISEPNYWYTSGDNKISRMKAQKHKLEKLLGKDNFDPKKTEKENMLFNGYGVVYDAGNKVFVFINKRKT